MNIIADLHTHTVASTHAYSTITEMVSAAKEKGLFALGVTDHSMTMIGAPDEIYFRNLHVLGEYIDGIRVLKGIEANIANFNGELDADDKLLKHLEWVVASLHSITIDDGEPNVEKCTAAYLGVCDNPYVNVIGHSGSDYYAYDYETVIKRCAQTSTLVEINSSAMRNGRSNVENCIKIAKLCMKHNARVVVDSDAHILTDVANVPEAVKMLESIGFPEELVVNSSVHNLKEYFKEKNISF
ncbi:MAG: phosphatase [Ruminococcus sp.]|nr:phosphatase [Ruminococcus sp.]